MTLLIRKSQSAQTFTDITEDMLLGKLQNQYIMHAAPV